jgi:hypothetical protein
LKDQLDENMIWTAPPYFWSSIEPVDNQFDWRELDGFVNNDSYPYKVIDLGPEFMAGEDGEYFMAGELPYWIENRFSNPKLKEQYGELIQAIVSRYKDKIDMWWIGLEVNLGGDGLSWGTWVDWLSWQTAKKHTSRLKKHG